MGWIKKAPRSGARDTVVCAGIWLSRRLQMSVFLIFLLVGFPGGGVVGPKGDFDVAVLYGGVVDRLAVGVHFEQVGDPAIGVLLFQFHEEMDGQLRGENVADDGNEIAIF